jgi:5'-nucleotidase
VHALVTNDDGIDSPGLAVLARAAIDAGYEVTVAAPPQEASGSSASLAGAGYDGRLELEQRRAPGLPDGVPSIAVSASPALIAFAASYGALGPRPDLILSGVNLGPNTGNAVLHSGTVGAAMSGTVLGIPSAAFSLGALRPTHWDTAAHVAEHVIDWLVRTPLDGRTVNVNVPDIPVTELRGLRQTPLASFGVVEGRVVESDERLVVMRYELVDTASEPESDAGWLAQGWATATLLRAPVADDGLDVPPL